MLPEWQSATFMELIKDIVRQLISNPGVTPVLNPAHHSLRLNIDKVRKIKYFFYNRDDGYIKIYYVKGCRK